MWRDSFERVVGALLLLSLLAVVLADLAASRSQTPNCGSSSVVLIGAGQKHDELACGGPSCCDATNGVTADGGLFKFCACPGEKSGSSTCCRVVLKYRYETSQGGALEWLGPLAYGACNDGTAGGNPQCPAGACKLDEPSPSSNPLFEKEQTASCQ